MSRLEGLTAGRRGSRGPSASGGGTAEAQIITISDRHANTEAWSSFKNTQGRRLCGWLMCTCDTVQPAFSRRRKPARELYLSIEAAKKPTSLATKMCVLEHCRSTRPGYAWAAWPDVETVNPPLGSWRLERAEHPCCLLSASVHALCMCASGAESTCTAPAYVLLMYSYSGHLLTNRS